MNKIEKILGLLVLLFINYNLAAQFPQIKWWYDTRDASFGQSAIAEIDRNGNKVIAFGCFRNDSSIYALNAADGKLKWKYNAATQFAEGCNDVAMLFYDIDKDDTLELIVPSSCNPLTYCFNSNSGLVKWKEDTRGSDSPPVIADLDQDGKLEILHGEFGGYVVCLDALTGKQKWEIAVDLNSWVQTAPTIVDVNQDGKLDFVVATWGFSDNSKLYAFDGNTQKEIWSIKMNDVVYHGTAVADLDFDDKPELVVGDYSGRLHVINAEDGSTAWYYQSDYYIGSPAVIGDLDGDSKCEIIFASYFKIIALSNIGDSLWQFNIPDYGQCFRGVVLSDINENGKLDVIFGSSNGSVYALDGMNGTPIWSLDLQAHYGDTFSIDHAPVIADFDNNDTLDLFVVGGKTRYPEFNKSYGRGYAIAIGKGDGPEWKMFQRDYYRTSSTCYPYNILSIVNEEKPFHFYTYPNPLGTRGELYLDININTDYKIAIHDIFGREVYCGMNIKSISINECSLEAGVYFITIFYNKGLFTNKIMITLE